MITNFAVCCLEWPCHHPHLLQSAIGMHSGEGEYVEFASECACEGPVETWLQSVVDSMKAAIQAEFKR